MTTTENHFAITVADLTRSCCANENYFAWLSNQADELRNSVEIAQYLGQAAEVFEQQAHSRREEFDELAARDKLADILMASARRCWEYERRLGLIESRQFLRRMRQGQSRRSVYTANGARAVPFCKRARARAPAAYRVSFVVPRKNASILGLQSAM